MKETFPFAVATHQHRVVMAIEYVGTRYKGWQVQKTGVSTVQSVLEQAIEKVANEPVATIVAGRTDAGVHASNQVIHFDTHSYRDPYGWTMGVNGHLPNDISVKWTVMADEHFHARFSAKERIYRFVIHNSWIKSANLHGMVTWEQFPLDVDLMQQAADTLIGTHDFSSFRAAECQAHSPVKTLREFRLQRFGDFIVIQVRANGFLHHMVRNLVGVLLPIGRGRKPIAWAQEVLALCDRKKGGVTAKGDGLYFVRAVYSDITLPVVAAGPAFIQPLVDALPHQFDAI